MSLERPIITLSDKWLKKAKDIGAARYAYAVKKGWKHYGEKDDADVSHHIVGAVGEAAAAKHYRLPWRPDPTNIHEGDVAGVLEVRARRVPGTGTDLAIRPKDEDDKPYLLVWIFTTEWSAQLIGWRFGKEVKNKGHTWCKPKGVWFIPPPYRSVKSLHDEIERMQIAQKQQKNLGDFGDQNLMTET